MSCYCGKKIYTFFSLTLFLPSKNTLLENVEQGFNEIEQTQIYLYGLDISGWSAKHKLPEIYTETAISIKKNKSFGYRLKTTYDK